MDLLRNPIIISIIVAALTYLYLYWENEKKNEKNPKKVKLTTPILVGVFTWFLASSYMNYKSTATPPQSTGGATLIDNKSMISVPQQPTVSDSFDSRTYHLIGRNNIRLPNTDVFIDIAKF